jgi:hypothetical protein
MRERCLDETRRRLGLVVQELLEIAHRRHDLGRRCRYEASVARDGSRRASSGCAGTRPGPSPRRARHQQLADLAQQPVAERELAGLDPLEPVAHRGDVIGRLLDVVERHSVRLLVLEEQQVTQRRLRSLDLRREHRLLADVRIQELARIGEQHRRRVEAAERDVSAARARERVRRRAAWRSTAPTWKAASGVRRPTDMRGR